MQALDLGEKRALTVLLIAAMLAAGPVMADKPDGRSAGKQRNSADERRVDKDKGSASRNKDRQVAGRQAYFEDRQRVILREYYEDQFRSGRCPPGLAKKNNGCMPPGQAKKWQVGQPLPRDVIFHSLPRAVEIQIGLPPAGHRYVRIATDILLIAIGTGMVIDAIEDLGR